MNSGSKLAKMTCPFCGGAPGSLVLEIEGGLCRVRCEGCGMKGNLVDETKGAEGAYRVFDTLVSRWPRWAR